MVSLGLFLVHLDESFDFGPLLLALLDTRMRSVAFRSVNDARNEQIVLLAKRFVLRRRGHLGLQIVLVAHRHELFLQESGRRG